MPKESRIDRRIWLISEMDVKPYPVRIANRTTGRVTYRICPGSTNKAAEQIEVDTLEELVDAVIRDGHGTRVVSSVDGQVNVRSLGGHIKGFGFSNDWTGPRYA